MKTKQPKTKSGKFVSKVLLFFAEPIDLLGKALIGDLWRTLYLTTQDAIALSLIVQLPGALGQKILGKNFSSFDTCLLENALGVGRYA
jgi:hypothetical protein